jgi:ATP-binding cassette subfamily B protein
MHAVLAMPLLMVLDHMDIAIVAGVGGTLAIKGIVTVGVVLAFIMYTQRLSQPLLQDGFLFSASVKENLRYGRLDATDEDIVATTTLANADQFIRRLPQGYDTVLAERGSDLSQGQRQLLTIARAILANPRILVLDEATSSVDTRTEIHIQQALLNLMKGRTSFVIAHQLSTIRTADQVLVIDGGHIIEHGTHASLLAQHGFYYNLYMSQFKGTATPAAVS